jgi:RimJ/RimL family protein N-acetyltransferase
MIDFDFGVYLKALDSTDIAELRSWRNDKRIWHWCRQYDLISDCQQERWFKDQDSDPTIHMYTVWTQSGKCGVCGFTSHDRHNRKAEFSLYIDPEKHGAGVGKMALKTLISHGFNNLNLHSIWGESFKGNPAIKMFKEIGMSFDGTRRDAYFRDGKYIDADLFSILEKEWKPETLSIP